ncbi:unnamed protein product [Phytophthora lilii]|uniref:Unnamed protein product n=1 Tax=Phytophthora lilii TaxID=2077276 RepID=A0A9W6X779_9STRA|nr:unnamed protein product [Phytophthora lilii]
MYQGASWATDIANGITTVAKKSTESTQTDAGVGPDEAIPNEVKQNLDDIIDQAIAQSDLKKSLNDENSVKIPEVSTPGTNVRPLSDVSIEGVSIPPVNSTATTSRIMGSEEQVASRIWITEFYKTYPNWASLGINPVKRDGTDDEKRVIRENGSLRSVKTGIKYKKYDAFDWVATEAKIREIWYEGESQTIDEVDAMRSEDKPPRSDRKRRGEDDIEDLDNKLKDPRLDLKYFNKSTSTKLDDDEAKYKLTWFIIQNKDLLEANNIQKSITPILKDGKNYKEGYLWIDANFRIYLFGGDTNKHRPKIQEQVNWMATLERFLSMIKDKGLKLVSNTEMDKSKIARDYEQADADIDDLPGIKTGKDEDMDKALAIPDLEAKTILTEYYKKLADNQVKIAVRLRPIVNSEKGEKIHPTYYLGEPTRTKPLYFRNAQHEQVKGDALSFLMKNIRWMDTFQLLLNELEDYEKYVEETEDRNLEKILDDNLKLLREAIFNNVSDVKTPLGYDAYGDEQLQKLHDEAEEAFQTYGEAYSQLEKNLCDLKKSESVANKEAVRASRAAVKATKAVHSVKLRAYMNKLRERGEIDQMDDNDTNLSASSKAKVDRANTRAYFKQLPQGSGIKRKLKGRGLRGAGVAPLEGVVRRGRTYNLNEIQGLATPSAYTYKQLGSKYIRIPDLDAKTLVIVQPNRRKCGPKCRISDSLQSMIRSLVYKNHIDQAAYDKLSIDDKKLFKEILAITHLQYSFHDKLTDPLETLRAEYDKLKGEMELGNDNPSIIKQLKSLTVDMYSNRLIGDKEFKQIITRLL